MLTGAISAEDSLLGVEEIAVQALAAAGTDEVIRMPVLVECRDIGASDLGSAFSTDDDIVVGRRGGLGHGEGGGATASRARQRRGRVVNRRRVDRRLLCRC